MSSFDLMSQIFGSREGHQINETIDNIGGVLLKNTGTQILQAVGLPTTVAGAISFIENAVTTQIDGLSNIDATEKAALLELIKQVFGAITTLPTPVAPVVPAAPPVKETPVFPTVEP